MKKLPGIRIAIAAAMIIAVPALLEGSERNYEELTESLIGCVKSFGDEEVFAITEEESKTGTTIRFISGNRNEKVDHATPLRITIKITRGRGGLSPKYSVRAKEEGIVFHRRDRVAERSWKETFRKQLAGET